ncbi:hypothetical protein [Bradyrhizobium cenepequi]
MLKYLTKFTVDILPSVAATVIGAYIVNHYIVAKPDAPAAAVSTPKVAAAGKPAQKPAEVSNLPEAGVKAKGMSERTLMERTASEKATVTEKPAEKATESKPAEAPAETASIPPAEPRRHQPAPREKAVAKVTPAPAQQPAVVPAAAPASPPPAEAAATPEDHRDANDLARAAIERLRGTADSGSRSPEAARSQEAPRVATAPSVVRPLPPPIMVSTPPSETFGQTPPPRPPYAASAVDDPNRPTPPADIPASRPPPLDLRADAAAAEPAKERLTIGDDMLSAAKSVFHAVLPK